MYNFPNKFSFRIIFLISVVILFAACQNRPKGVLNQQEMTEILSDLHKLDGILIEKGYMYDNEYEKERYYNYVLKKYGIRQAQFDSSLVWYGKNPKQFEKIYTNVMINLENFQNEIKSRKYHPIDSAELARKKDQLWSKAVRYQFTKDSVRNKLNFEIANSDLLLGDVYVLKFLQRIALQDSCKDQRVVLRIHYQNGQTDSVYHKAYNDSLLRRYTFRFPARKALKIKSISGELLGSSSYRGTFNALIDSVSLIREYNSDLQDSLRLVVQKADSIDYSFQNSAVDTIGKQPKKSPKLLKNPI
jgi:hypothetical protein